MAGNIHSPEAHEKTITSPEAGLQGLLDRVLANGRHAVAAALTVLTLSSPVSAEENPGNKGAQQGINIGGESYTFAQIATFPSEKQVALLEAITNPMQKIKLTGYLNEMANQRIDEKTKAIEAANQNNQETAERITKKQEASNQMSSLFSLLEELLREQGIQTTPNDKYRTRAVIVSNILANPLLFAKFDQETITLLRNIETSLYNGKNPFAYMSKEGKKKLQSLLKS